ncbi:MAG: helix-turn-helix transcriptional regulator [Acidobacteriaceae bacterium]|nr:helix-turn-helix transcriptional regulator [Acidobacteriaceae bacterium]
MVTESSEETLRRALASYEIGRKLRQLRMRKKIALVDLGKHTGLSASMISQLENGRLVPTLPTLARIAMVFDVGLDHFFGHKRRRGVFSIVRGDQRIKFPDRPDNPRPAFVFECLAFSIQDKSLQAYLAEFPRRAPDEVSEHLHDGAEFLHVLEGSLMVRYEEEDHILKAGDSVYFDPSEPHSYRGLSKPPARALVITTPPRS